MMARLSCASTTGIPPLAVVLIAVVLNPDAFAQMTAREFDALPDEDKRTILVSALQKRDEAVRNVRAISVTRSYNVTFAESDLTVEAMKEIDGVWFPVRIRTVNTSTRSVEKGEAGVFETEASDIELGSVKPADMEIVFPADMKVHDLFTGKWTLAGAEIDPNAPTKPAEPIAPLEPIEQSTGRPRILWFIGIVVACVGIILFVLSKRHRHSGPST